MDSSLGGWAANDTDGLARAFASAGICLRSLSADRQSAQVTDAAVAFNALQPFEVHANFAAQIAFNDVLAVLDGMNDLGKLLFGEILGANAGINLGFGQDIFRVGGADAVNVAQGNIDPLIGRDFNTDDTSHKFLCLTMLVNNRSALALFVPGVGADHTNDAFAANNFTIFAKLLN